MASANESPEMVTLNECNPTLVKCIQRSPKEVADHLHSILTAEDLRFIANEHHDEGDRARRIITAMKGCLEMSLERKRADKFQTFVDALWAVGQWTEDIVELLEEKYIKNGGCALNKEQRQPHVSTSSVKRTGSSSSTGGASSKDTSQEPSSSGPPQLSVESLVQNIPGLTFDKLKTSVEDAHIYMIAGYFDRVDGYVEKLGLLPGKQTDVKDICYRRGVQMGMVEAIKSWRSPNPFQATYQALLKVLIDMKKGDVATKIAQYIAKNV